MEEKRFTLFDCDYFSLWNDGIIGVSDGVGFIGSIEQDKVKELYLALKKYFKKDDVTYIEWFDHTYFYKFDGKKVTKRLPTEQEVLDYTPDS